MKQENPPLVMRIITRLAGGGPPVHTTLLNRGLDSCKFESVLVYGGCSIEEMNMDYLLADGDRVEFVNSLAAKPNPILDCIALYKLWKLMRRYRPAIVHTHTAKAGFLGRLAAILAGVPHIVHTYHGHVLDGYFGKLTNHLLRSVERLLGRVSTALCAVSNQQAEELSTRFLIAPRNKFRVVPLGLDLTSYLSIPVPNFNAPRMTIGWLGRFVPIKNLPLLIEIVEGAAELRLPIDFLVAGEGPERKWLEDAIQTRKLANIQILPWQDHVEGMLGKCHLMVLTSHREGTPLSLIQAMAAARPFVSTPAGGTVDLAIGVGRYERDIWWHENSVLCKASAEVFLRVFALLNSDRQLLERMSESSRTFATTSFGEARLVSDIESLYRELLAIPESERIQTASLDS